MWTFREWFVIKVTLSQNLYKGNPVVVVFSFCGLFASFHMALLKITLIYLRTTLEYKFFRWILLLRIRYIAIYIYIYFKNTKNLFIHIALIPEGDNPRVNPNILKCLLHSPVAKGYRLVVIASRAMVCKTPTYYLILNSLAFARGCVILRSHILFPLWLFCLYLIIFNLNYPFWSVIITLWLLCAYFTAISGGCWPIKFVIWFLCCIAF